MIAVAVFNILMYSKCCCNSNKVKVKIKWRYLWNDFNKMVVLDIYNKKSIKW
jgi:hypothetical protein